MKRFCMLVTKRTPERKSRLRAELEAILAMEEPVEVTIFARPGECFVHSFRGNECKVCGFAACTAQSPGSFDGDEAEWPVNCSLEEGHTGKHEGGARCGTVTW